MSIDSVMPSNHLVLCRPLLLPSVFPSIWVFSNESALGIRWPKYWSFSFSISPSSEYSGLISFRGDKRLQSADSRGQINESIFIFYETVLLLSNISWSFLWRKIFFTQLILSLAVQLALVNEVEVSGSRVSSKLKCWELVYVLSSCSSLSFFSCRDS